MAQNYKIWSLAVISVLLAGSLSGCIKSAPVVVKNSNNLSLSGSILNRGVKLIMIPPKIEYIQTQSKNKLAGKQYRYGLMEKTISTRSYEILTRKKYFVVRHSDRELTEQAHALFRTRINDETAALITQTCVAYPKGAVLAHHLVVKVGGRSTWNHNSGELKPNINTTLLRVIAVDCHSRKKIWRNEIFFRKLPIVNEKGNDKKEGNLKKSINLLYQHSEATK